MKIPKIFEDNQVYKTIKLTTTEYGVILHRESHTCCRSKVIITYFGPYCMAKVMVRCPYIVPYQYTLYFDENLELIDNKTRTARTIWLKLAKPWIQNTQKEKSST